MLKVQQSDAVPRRDEPVVIGVPLPRGCAPDRAELALLAESGAAVPCDVQTLDRWFDGSSRWLLLAFRASAGPGSRLSRFEVRTTAAPRGLPQQPLSVERQNHQLVIRTGGVEASMGPGSGSPLRDVRRGGVPCLDAAPSGLRVVLPDGSEPACQVHRVAVEFEGAVRAVVAAQSTVSLPGNRRLEVDWRLEFWAGSPTVIVHLTVLNPHRAQHPGGHWELGDPGSVLLKSVEFRATAPGGCSSARCSAERGEPHAPVPVPFELYQDSSGGENWRSPNHVNREGRVPTRFRGYRRSDQPDREHLRASPIVTLDTPAGPLSVAVRQFWENFPKALEVDAAGITLGLWPRQWDDLHELQGGEQKTHTFAIAFGDDGITDVPLHWFRQPVEWHLDPEWLSRSEAVPGLTPAAASDEDHRRLASAAVDGDDTLERKRELLDEYGWRHFGDIYGDHEAVGHEGASPLVSHYNNQYDPIFGLAVQFLRTGDARWFRHCDELARHVADVDIYHTDEDKPAYNHGLFWHTAHYTDAGRSTHRTYPNAPGVPGGGPSNEHNYSTGLALHYDLTGDPRSRDAVLELATWTLDMEDGAKTVFRWLSRHDTGLSSQTGSASYHGPGRGPANCIVTLLNAWRLTHDRRYLDGATRLVRRCIHPLDDLGARNLLDAERRWYYTVFLQALGTFLQVTASLGDADEDAAYARESLLHYARWMVANEYPYLERPEILEYPNETWAAQDMRKSEVFYLAALHAPAGHERERFLDRARYFHDHSVRQLLTWPTRSRTRPVVLMLQNGWKRPWFEQQLATAPSGRAATPAPWSPPEAFEPQKSVAMRRAKALAALGGGTATLAAGALLWRLLS